jgi:hypothetical protein
MNNKLLLLVVMTLNLGVVVAVNWLNFSILLNGKVILVEPILLVIVSECIVVALLGILDSFCLFNYVKDYGRSLRK